MTIASVLRKFCVQPCVYWGAPVNDGSGGFTFADPVEILVRWEDVTRILSSSDGKEKESKATVLLQQDVDEQGYLFLGTLDDLDALDSEVESSGTVYNPMNIEEAYPIIGVERIPFVRSTTVFVRTAYLGFRNI